MSSSYAQAKQQLSNILAGPEFRPKKPHPTSWLQIAWNWIVRHLHLPTGWISMDWRSMAWVVFIGLCVILFAGMVWWFRGRNNVRAIRIVGRRLRRDPHVDALTSAREAFSAGRYGWMLHDLTDHLIDVAAHEGWIRPALYKTTRAYARECVLSADADFVSLFRTVARAAETVLFGGANLSPETAAQVLHDVTAYTPVRMAVVRQEAEG